MLQVRWPLAVEGLAEIKEPGQQVTVTDVVEKKKVKIGNNEVDVRGLVQTSLGLVPISYLEPKNGQANRWWLGRLSPVEVGLLLSRDPALIMGSYAVCQPPEMDPLAADEWAEFVLVVRNISGDVDQWMYEWEIDYKFNQRFSKSFKKRKIVNDIICGPPHGAVPPIAYYVIKRTPIAKRLLSLDKEQKESLFKAYLYYNGIYSPATIRRLRPKLFNQKTFDKDIEKIQEGNIRNGYSFLSHIIGLGFEEDADAMEGTDGSDLEWPWWAPECLMHRTFNIVTDVWAFGCVIFEVEYTFLSLQALFAKGENVELPSGYNMETYLDDLFYMCTSYKPNDRPSFDYMFKFFRELLFDFAVGPEAAIKQYIKKSKRPKHSSHRKTVKDS
ncbi:unnamed protein product [Angiostrongylus costaricensis]|uniref:Pkinase_Tyr domain-containing protein n=1 Tax=Angiostrongylus costaricensis TaxID=334426 RepID=A0A158PIC6_ANGCS|nr:unnamed protein product [Angiostrongylus costaricensis]